jgi:N-acetylglucosamine kinase-like BadF-type ATPase
VCGTGSIAWGRNAAGEIARAGGWGWHLADEGSGFWIGEQAMRAVMRAYDGRGPATSLVEALSEHFGLSQTEGLVRSVYDREYPRQEVALFSVRVAAAASAGDEVAREILTTAASELVLAARTVVRRLRLEEEEAAAEYDVVLSGGTFRALPELEGAVTRALSEPATLGGLSESALSRARIRRLEEEPAVGAVRLALDELALAGGAA